VSTAASVLAFDSRAKKWSRCDLTAAALENSDAWSKDKCFLKS
jgi:hypothetical protein